MTKTIVGLGATAVLVAAGTAPAEPQKQEAVLDDTAAKTTAASVVVATVGEAAPDFTLKDTEGREYHLADYSDRVVVLEWFNPDCPFVKKHHLKNKTMQATSAEWVGKEVVWLAINSGAPGKQGAGLDRNRKAQTDYGIAYPILLDEAGRVGRLYGAKTTPHMFVIDKGTLVYAGAIDDNSSPSKLGETNHVDAALRSCTHGKAVEVSATKPYGCTVKYGSAAM
jgi:peroxiredoxin